MKIKTIFVSLVLAVSLASAVPGLENGLGDIELSAGYWMSSGDLSWDISFYEYVDGLGWIEGRSRLEWETDSDYITLEALYSRAGWFGRLQYATGDIDSGTCWDSDWMIVPGYAFTNEPWLRSFNPADGENDFYLLDVGYVFESGPGGSTGVFLGYQKKTLGLCMHDPLTYDIVDWEPAYQVYNDGLASTYDIEFTGFRIGLESEVTSGEKVAVRGLVAYYPKVDVEGIGYWNMRDLRFTQTGDGTGIELVGSILYSFSETWSGELGYRLQEFEQKGGTDIKHFSDGTTGETAWEQAKSSQDGFFLAIRCVF